MEERETPRARERKSERGGHARTNTFCLRTEGIRKENYQAIVEFALKAQKLETFPKNSHKDQLKVKQNLPSNNKTPLNTKWFTS